jgi:RNA polymerase sigma-70 factor (ECF subfamily)
MRNHDTHGTFKKSREDDASAATLLATFDQYRSLLFSIAYRMLGSVADAEDMLQETFLRWQQVPEDSIRSPRALLVTIVSRLCINQLESTRSKREQYIGQWLPEPIVTEPGSNPLDLLDLDESVSMAFLVMLERLTAVERAVFLLREVFEYEYAEIAQIVGQSEANCRQILHRARQRVGTARPRFSAPEPKHNELLERFLEATTSGDMKGLIELLADDVVLQSDGGGKAVAVPNVISGVDRVGRGILGGLEKLVPKNLVRRMAQINGEPGIINYLDGRPYAVISLNISEGRIHSIYIITNPEKLSHLPDLTVSRD